jgi:SPP1 family predicted phage head-tail adaptor
MVKLNRRVTVQVTGATRNDQGGLVADVVDSWDKWAHVENRSGSNSSPLQQQVWDYDYKITMRFEKSRPTQSNYEIIYGTKRLKINSVSIDSEAFQFFEVLRCSTIDNLVSINQSS